MHRQCTTEVHKPKNELFDFLRQSLNTKSWTCRRDQRIKLKIPAELLLTKHVNESEINRGCPLVYALKNNFDDETILQILQVDGIDVNMGDGKQTPLMAAIGTNNIMIMQELLRHPSLNINTTQEVGQNALFYAVNNKCTHAIISQLLETKGMDVNIPSVYGYVTETPLGLAIRNNNQPLLKKILSHPSINVFGCKHNAEKSVTDAFKGDVEILIYLLHHDQFDMSKEDVFHCIEQISRGTEKSFNQDKMQSTVTSKLYIDPNRRRQNPHTNDALKAKLLKTIFSWVYQYSRNKNTLIQFSVHRQHYDMVTYLLERPWLNLDVNSFPKEQLIFQCPLLLAAAQNHRELAGQILNHKGFNRCTKDKDDRNIMMGLMNLKDPGSYFEREKRNTEEWLFQNFLGFSDINISDKDREGKTVLMHAALNGIQWAVTSLVKIENININQRDNYGKTALTYAVTEKYEKNNLQTLLDQNNLEVNTQDKDGFTALIHAVCNKKTEELNILLKHPKINVNLQDKYCRTALIHAVCNERNETLNILLKHPKVNVNLQNKHGLTALIHAVCNERNEAFKILLKHPKINVNLQDKHGRTALMHASMQSLHTVLMVLLAIPELNVNTGYQKHVKDARVFTNPLLCVLSQIVESMKVRRQNVGTKSIEIMIESAMLLISHQSFDCNISDSNHKSALMYFCDLKYEKSDYIATNRSVHNPPHQLLNKFLTMPGLLVNNTDDTGMTALLHAIKERSKCYFTALLSHPGIDVNKETNVTVNGLGKTTALKFILQQYKPKLKGNIPVSQQKPYYLLEAREKDDMQAESDILEKLVCHATFAEDVNDPKTEDQLTALHVLTKDFKFNALLTLVSKYEVQKEMPCIDPFVEDSKGITVWEAICMSHQTHRRIVPDSQNMETKLTQSMSNLENSLIKMTNREEIDVNRQDKTQKTMLHYLCMYGINKVATVFLQRENINLNLQEETGHTPLMYGVGKLDVEVIGEFLNNPRCDLLVRNKYQQTVQTISDSMESNELDPRVRSLITAAYDNIKCKPTKSEMQSELGISEQLLFLKRSMAKDALFTQEEKQQVLTQIEGIESDVEMFRRRHPQANDSMTDIQNRKLLKKRVFLCEEMFPQELFDYFIEDGILTDDKVEEIKASGVTRRGMCQRLLSILPRCGKTAYSSLIRALKDSCQGHIAEELENFNPDKEPNQQTMEGTMQVLENTGLFAGHQPMMSVGQRASVMVPVQITQDGAAFMTIPRLNVGNGSQ